MPINLIACVLNYKNRLAIGQNNGLLFHLKEDMKFFRNITSDCLSPSSRIGLNVVVMGRKTWFSIPKNRRPLRNRINIVLTNNNNFLKSSEKSVKNLKNLKNIDPSIPYYMTLNDFHQFYEHTQANVFVIGGGEIYNTFLNSPELKPHRVYLTEISNFKPPADFEPDAYMNHLDDSYHLAGVSNKYHDTAYNIDYRYLTYHSHEKRSQEGRYLELCKHILTHGKPRSDRTGTGTISSFGHQLKFDISHTIPLLTTKRVPWKHVIEELLWFMRGDTDAKILQRAGVKIWDGNTSRQFLDNRGLTHYDEGILGAGYGWQWRFFGAEYDPTFADTRGIDRNFVGGFDQLEYIVNEIRTNPYSRRILMCYWNPPDFDKTALQPCHFSVQFYVDFRSDSPHLDCHFTMRSNDVFLGQPFNIFSYAVMTYIIALKCDMKPGNLVYSGGDVHIYQNHIKQTEEQLSRTPRPLPILLVNPDVKWKAWEDITLADFEIVGYFPHPAIRAPMAV